jgi:TolA-binding protein
LNSQLITTNEKENEKNAADVWTDGCWLRDGCDFSHARPAAVSDADFNALKDMVQQMNGKLQSLEQTNQLDQQTIQQLQQQLGETQKTAADAEQKSIAAAQAQSLPRVPIDEATVNHNFQILGDAEFQYVKTPGQNGAFLLADFAPIFLYRAGDNILFEAGFDTTLQNNAPNSSRLFNQLRFEFRAVGLCDE